MMRETAGDWVLHLYFTRKRTWRYSSAPGTAQGQFKGGAAGCTMSQNQDEGDIDLEHNWNITQ